MKDTIQTIKNTVFIIAIIAALVVCYRLYVKVSNADVGSIAEFRITSPDTILVSPQVITQIKSLGQWEFLTVEDEEIVEQKHNNTILAPDIISVIYKGTLRIGVDLRTLPDDWVQNRNDTLTVTLPQCTLLDNDFIDEATSEVFYQRGHWDNSTRTTMRRQAENLMRRRALTPENIERANASAKARFNELFRSLGAKEVIVNFTPQKAH